MKINPSIACTLVSICCCLPGNVFGNGLDNEFIGAKAAPMASAFVGIADDESAVAFNPAGLSFNEKDTLYTQIFAFANFVNFEYTANSITDESNEIYYTPALFMSKTYERWAFGFGFYTPEGGGGFAFEDLQDIPGNDVEVLLGVVLIHPVVAYRLTPNLSIGGGPFLAYSQYEEDVANLGFRSKKEYDGIAGYGGNIGILYKPTDTLSVGFSVRSEIPIEMDGEEKINGIKFDSEIEFTVPYYFDLGFGYKPNPGLTFGINFCRMLWGDMDEYEFTVEGKRATNWKDSWRIGLGMDYQINSDLAFRAGFKFKENSQAKDNGAIYPGTSEINLWGISIGFGYSISESMELNTALAYTYGKDDYQSQEVKASHWSPALALRCRF